ncbi:MAG: enoyl-CoA hydratase/isomerase family protein [bacterium]
MPLIQHLRLDDPPRNVLSIAVLTRLATELAGLATDADAVIWSSSLPWGFSAGVDIKEHVPEQVPAMLAAIHVLFRQMVDLPCLLVAEVHGPCLGGAAELAFACDMVVASDNASFAFPEITVGCFPPIALATLGQRLGHVVATELIISGRHFTAQEAQALGLVNKVVPQEVLVNRTQTLVEEWIEDSSRGTRRQTLQTLRRIRMLQWEAGLALAEAAYADLPTGDQTEGIAAFLEKRPPVWGER